MNSKTKIFSILVTLAAVFTPFPTSAQWVSGLQGASGSTVGPDGYIYVTEGAIGQISRVDPQTGDVSVFASGLPHQIIPLGGVMDVAFLDGTAYALVTLVGPDVGGTDIVGIYRIDGPSSYTVIADIGTFAMNNPPLTDFFVPTGVQYALEPYRGGFLVTDGHHNRVLNIRLDGDISEFQVFENIVPTGLEVHGKTVYMAEAGPTPHLPEDGKIVAIDSKSLDVTQVASGGRLLVDVEYGLGQTLYALAQGVWDGLAAGSSALPYTGELLRVNADGTFNVVASEVNLPTSMEFIGNTAYVVSLAGDIYKYDDVSSPPFGKTK
ncbi:MAG: ScyD/ScyE family protein [Lysobacterales bacterium]